MDSLIPIIINKTKDPDGLERFRAALSLEELILKPSLSKQIMEIQEAYAKLIQDCKVLLKTLKSSRKNRGNPLLKWDLAKKIVNFMEQIEDKGYHFANSANALSRDLGISERQVNYLIEFAKTFPRKEMLHPQISWDKYKEILDVKNRQFQLTIIKKLLDGELKTRDDIRKFKKTLK